MQGTRADTAVFVAVADAELREASPLASYGTGATMVSGGLGDNVDNTRRRALFKFDLGDRIPPGSVIQSVSVTVDVVLRLPGAAANSDFGLHRLLRSWRETAVTWTWANNPIAPWGQPGASSATDAVALPSAKVAVSALGQYTFDSTGELVADVQDWLDRPNSNAGWLLRSETEAPFTARHFASRESSTGGATLTVDYEPPPLLEPVTIGAVTAQNAQLRFTFEGRGGTAYRVEFREGLASGDWQTITNIPAQAVSGLIAVLHPIQGMAGYYRIETVPTRSMESDRYHSRPGLPQVTSWNPVDIRPEPPERDAWFGAMTARTTKGNQMKNGSDSKKETTPKASKAKRQPAAKPAKAAKRAKEPTLDTAFRAGDQRRWHFECPSCRALQPLKLELLRWYTNATAKPEGK